MTKETSYYIINIVVSKYKCTTLVKIQHIGVVWKYTFLWLNKYNIKKIINQKIIDRLFMGIDNYQFVSNRNRILVDRDYFNHQLNDRQLLHQVTRAIRVHWLEDRWIEELKCRIREV